jgi:hypothetical protein
MRNSELIYCIKPAAVLHRRSGASPSLAAGENRLGHWHVLRRRHLSHDLWSMVKGLWLRVDGSGFRV